MADESNHPSSHQTASPPQPRSTIHKDELLADLPPQERVQPDPALQLSAGRLSPVAVVLWTIAIAVIIGVVWYGFTRPAPKAEHPSTKSARSSDPSTAALGRNAAATAKPAAPPSPAKSQH